MPLWLPPAILMIAILVTLFSLGWLLLNARAVARVFSHRSELEPGPAPQHPRNEPGRGKVLTMLVLFNLGWIGATATWAISATDEAQTVVNAEV